MFVIEIGRVTPAFRFTTVLRLVCPRMNFNALGNRRLSSTLATKGEEAGEFGAHERAENL